MPLHAAFPCPERLSSCSVTGGHEHRGVQHYMLARNLLQKNRMPRNKPSQRTAQGTNTSSGGFLCLTKPRISSSRCVHQGAPDVRNAMPSCFRDGPMMTGTSAFLHFATSSSTCSSRMLSGQGIWMLGAIRTSLARPGSLTAHATSFMPARHLFIVRGSPCTRQSCCHSCAPKPAQLGRGRGFCLARTMAMSRHDRKA